MLALMVWASVWVRASGLTAGTQDAPKTVWDGVYTEAQAERGKALYM